MSRRSHASQVPICTGIGWEDKLTENAFSRTGYSFANWNTKADGTGTAYTDAQAVENIALSGTVKLYAQWAS